MNKRHYEHTLPNIRGSLSNTYVATGGVTQTFPDMEEHSEKYTVHLYIEPIITE